MQLGSYPVVSRVKERDTTFLAVELLASSPEFRAWFCDRVSASTSEVEFIGVTRSVETYGRETDIRVEFDIGETRHLALIENKIDASFGEQQIPDYHERAEHYEQDGRCDRAVVVLLAPASRADATTRERFDYTITYEQVCDQLQELTHDSATFATEIFQIALDQQTKTDKSDLMTRLAERINPTLQEIAPHLETEVTDNRLRIKSADAEFPDFVWYEIRAKFGTLGRLASGVRLSTDDSNDLRTIYRVLESGFDELPLDGYRTQLASDHQKKQGMIEWALEVSGEPEAVSDHQIQQTVDVTRAIIQHYHEPLRNALSD